MKTLSGVFFFICVLCFSCAPKYGAYFPKSTYDANNYAKSEHNNADTKSDETLLVSVAPVAPEPEEKIQPADIKLVESVEVRETKLVQNTTKEKDEILPDERGVLELVGKTDRNATMGSREELIMDALRVKLQSMTKEEKKAFRKDVKHFAKTKDFEKLSSAYNINSPEDVKATDTNTLLLVIIAILLPPLAVFLYEGEINKNFWINLLLTILFYIPGLIHALILIL